MAREKAVWIWQRDLTERATYRGFTLTVNRNADWKVLDSDGVVHAEGHEFSIVRARGAAETVIDFNMLEARP